MTEEDDIATNGYCFEEDDLSSTDTAEPEPQPKPKRARRARTAPAKTAPKKSAPKSPAPKKASARGKKSNGVAPVASHDYHDVSLNLKQASDPTRIAIMLLLSDGPRNVRGICSELGLTSQPAVSHHLALLRHGRIVAASRQGQNNFYSLEDTGRKLVSVIKSLTSV